MNEILVFGAFYAIMLTCDSLAKKHEKLTPKDLARSHVKAKIVGVVAVVAHHQPFLHAAKDYIVHFVVYSGMVLPAH